MLGWLQESEIEVHGIEKAKEAMQIMEQQLAAEVSCAALAEWSSAGSGGR